MLITRPIIYLLLFKRGTDRQSVTSWSRDFPVSRLLPIFSSLGIGIGKFGLRKKVLVSVSENLVSEKILGISIKKFGLGKSLGIGIGKFGLKKKVAKKRWPKVARSCL